MHGKTELSVGRLRSKAQRSSFAVYAASTLPRAGIDLGSIPEGAADALFAKLLPSLGLFRAAWTLRALIGATIEGIVLADRWMWCVDNGISARAGPGWDAQGSPRNWVFSCRRFI